MPGRPSASAWPLARRRPSSLVRQYVIGHAEGSIEIRERLFNNHRDAMLKLVTPLAFPAERSSAETLYSAAQRRPSDEHEERTNQPWVAVRGRQGGKPVYLAVLNTGSFAHSLTSGEFAVNVVRPPAYSSFNIDPRDERLNNRFAPRQDQGEQELRYALLVGGASTKPG